MGKEIYNSSSEEDTIRLGKIFAERLKEGDSVALSGDLGAGKTEFIKGICNHFSVHELVTSPTFTIMNQYVGFIQNHDISIYHIDLYRIEKNEELEDIGFLDCMKSNNSIKLIEWAEKANEFLPKATYKVNILTNEIDESTRSITIESV